MKSSSSSVFGLVLFLIVMIFVGYGCWKLERWWHYKFSYQSQVQQDMKPLANRISDLEARVSVLETNINKR